MVSAGRKSSFAFLGRGSPRRKSPSRRERSPARHRSSGLARSPVRDKPSSRTRSPKHAKAAESRSPVREKPSSRQEASKHLNFPGREKPSSRTRSPRRKGSASPVRRSPSPRTKRLRRTEAEKETVKVNERDSGRTAKHADMPVRQKPSSLTRSPKRTNSTSPVSPSPSPRTKRLTRASAENEAIKLSERDHGRKHGKGSNRDIHKESNSGREPVERRDRKGGRDAVDNGSSRSRQKRSTSPSDRNNRSRHDTRTHDEVVNDPERGESRNGDKDSVAKMAAAEEELQAKEKQKPSFELSGKLAEETNRFRGVTLLFTEPPDARKPDIRWRLYNAALRREGLVGVLSRPAVNEFDKAISTENRIEPQRYYELFEKDTIKFGNSSREYVLLHENSND
ncbi:hypothetical protein RJ640_023201 [Escallonia rubra]|uniref:Uncharacterized protein n=1 Tax=Escallonia rubra TaxID=112253 RepID=A0AA88RAG6_9ASTE|nr:hypothetical protein RJ640_023201 [Escallonia rubra]